MSVVGTRKPSAEGAVRARALVQALVRRRIVVVSGLAAGIDTIAHTVALDEHGHTIADFSGQLDDGDRFGWGASALGDFDGNDVEDIAVGAYFDDDGGGGRGAVWILFLETDGTVKAHQKISDTAGGFGGGLSDDDGFGISATPLGDLDGDAVPDLGVGAYLDDDGGSNRGAVWILFLNPDGTVRTEQKISALAGGLTGPLADEDLFGYSVAALGDLDGSGPSERALAVGARHDDQGAPDGGALWILFLASDGTVLSEAKITEGTGGFAGDLDASDILGQDCAYLGSVGGPGVVDLAVGASQTSEGGVQDGALWILSLDSTGAVVGQQKISSVHGNFQGVLDSSDEFGSGLASLGDLDGDGRLDLAVGAFTDSDGATSAGAVWICYLNDGTLGLGASSTTWTGATNRDWTDPTNWTNGTPDAAKSAVIVAAANTPQVPASNEACDALWIQRGGTLELAGGADNLGVFGGATVLGPIDGTGEFVFEASGVLAGRTTISLAEVRADAELAVQGGLLVLTGDLAANADVALDPGADLEVQSDLLVQGDLTVDGALSVGDSLTVGGGIFDSVAGQGGGSIFVGGSGECVTAGEVCFHGEVATACVLRIEDPSGSSSNLDIENGWPAGMSIDVLDTITLLTSDFQVGGDLVVENGTLAVGVDGSIGVAGANGIVIEAPGTLDLGTQQTLVPAPAPITVRGKLNLGPGGLLLLESNALTVEGGGTLCLSGGVSNLAGIAGSSGGGYALTVGALANVVARNFSFTGMGPAGVTLDRDALIAAPPFDLRNGFFDFPVTGGRLLALERAAPATLRYLRFENTSAAAGAANVHVPAASATVTLVNWSGAFSGPAFEDDPASKLDWGPPELTSASLSARWKPDHVLVEWTTTSEIDAEAFVLRRSIEPSGPFVDMHETLAVGPTSYSFVDWTVAPGTAYRYRLYERLTHGLMVQLDETLLPASELPAFLPNWGRPAPPPPPLPLVVGPGGAYADVPAALSALAATHAGKSVTLELAPGAHAAFELGRELAFDLRLVARPGAWIDAADGPVRIANLPAERSLELIGLVIDAGGFERSALVVEDSAGVVLLDGGDVQGGVRLAGALAVAFLGGAVTGELALEGGSRAAAWSIASDPVVEAGSVWRTSDDAARLSLAESSIELEGRSGSVAWLLHSPRLGWSAPVSAHTAGIWLLDPANVVVLPPRVLLDGKARWSLPPSGAPLQLQALQLDGGRFALSRVVATR